MSYLFGPVPSRRLGFSLGIDAIPFKTCSFNCIYCELGGTTHLSIKPRAYVDASQILKELEAFFEKEHPPVDYITIGGSGEPTLNTHIGEIISEVKKLDIAPVAVLTNGSLLWKEKIASRILEADVVLPSLDTVRQETFHRLNRPHPGLNIDKIIKGLKDFKRNFLGKFWLEVLFVRGINDKISEIHALKQVLDEINPDYIHLNTVVRPPSEKIAHCLSKEELIKIQEILGPKAKIIADFKGEMERGFLIDIKEKVLDMLGRRPCTLEDIVHSSGIHVQEGIKLLQDLIQTGKVSYQVHEKRGFYKKVQERKHGKSTPSWY